MHAWVSNSIPSTAMVKVVLTLLLLTEPVIDSFWTRLFNSKKIEQLLNHLREQTQSFFPHCMINIINYTVNNQV